MQEFNTETLVIKPTVSASGNNTFLINSSGAKNSINEESITTKFTNQSVIVQPFIENIRNGEYAIVFINGNYSHAAIRFPGIFAGRKSPIYINKASISKSILSLATKCSNSMKDYFGEFPIYARYDIVDGYIMEVELAEPDLMTRTISNSAHKEIIINNLAKTIIKRIGR
jgi:glutathione synthase/RimK-type ligase-like ATP-grasp enzyme